MESYNIYLFCLAFKIQHNYFEIHLSWNVQQQIIPFYSPTLSQYTDIPQCFYSLTCRYFSCFHVFTIKNKVRWAWVYKSLCGHMLWFLKGKYSGCIVGQCLNFKNLPSCFPKQSYYFTFSPALYEFLIAPHPWKYLGWPIFLILAILESM